MMVMEEIVPRSQELVVDLGHGDVELFLTQEWASFDITNDGALAISRADGTKKVYAPGRWASIDHRMS